MLKGGSSILILAARLGAAFESVFNHGSVSHLANL